MQEFQVGGWCTLADHGRGSEMLETRLTGRGEVTLKAES